MADLCVLVGVVVIGWALWVIWPPLAGIWAGLLLIGVGTRLQLTREKGDE